MSEDSNWSSLPLTVSTELLLHSFKIAPLLKLQAYFGFQHNSMSLPQQSRECVRGRDCTERTMESVFPHQKIPLRGEKLRETTGKTVKRCINRGYTTYKFISVRSFFSSQWSLIWRLYKIVPLWPLRTTLCLWPGPPVSCILLLCHVTGPLSVGSLLVY